MVPLQLLPAGQVGILQAGRIPDATVTTTFSVLVAPGATGLERFGGFESETRLPPESVTQRRDHAGF